MSVEELPKEYLNIETNDPIVWVYVNVLTGKHIKSTLHDNLAVFRTEEAARSWEPESKTLQRSICYEVSWEEMLSIANTETEGKYVIL